MKKQQGVALIVVLLLVTLMSLIASQMTERLQKNFYRVESQILHQQTYWYGFGIEALAKVAIEQSLKDSDTATLNQPWATKDRTYPLDNGDVTGTIIDRQACFNLNALAKVKSTTDGKKPYLVGVLQTLLEDSGVESYAAETIADSSWEFVDSDDAVQSATGAEDSTYAGLSPAYLPPDSLLANVTEFRAVNGVTAKIYNEVSPLLCALPTTEFKLNVNTLDKRDAPLLAAMFAPNLSVSDAEKLIADRPYNGWDKVEDFLAESVIKSVSQDTVKKAKAHLDVTSHYFQLDAEINVDRMRMRLVSLLKRDDKNKVTVVRRQYGGIRERISDDKAE
ncbi:TPA: type II secretion system minor pseudopilin GspK [Photobacterium damselae]